MLDPEKLLLRPGLDRSHQKDGWTREDLGHFLLRKIAADQVKFSRAFAFMLMFVLFIILISLNPKGVNR